jgi:hypothetical protein
VKLNAPATVTATFVSLNSARLAGISTRLSVGIEDDVMIGGFAIDGLSPKTVVLRARGVSLGVAGALADPQLTLVKDGVAIAANDDWASATNAEQLVASGFAPGDPKESALLTTLEPGVYTMIVSGVGNTTGVAIAEVYEIDTPEAPLVGISTRGRVRPGDEVMIAGFIIKGEIPQTVVIRAQGPSLISQGISGALLDPTLVLVGASGLIATNDDWQNDFNAAALQASGLAPRSAKDAALLVTLDPGAYTAIVMGVGSTTGVAIVEVYQH